MDHPHAATEAVELEEVILAAIDRLGTIDSQTYAEEQHIDHQRLVGELKSLSASEMVVLVQRQESQWKLTEEGLDVLANGAPESRVWALLPKTQAEIEGVLGAEAAKIGLGKLAKAVNRQKTPEGLLISRAADTFEDVAQRNLRILHELGPVPAESIAGRIEPAALEELKKRKHVTLVKITAFVATKGPKFALQRVKPVTALTREMLLDGSWRTATFKELNLNSLGKPPQGGHLHPLLKLRQAYREIFLELGFQEMDTSRWVESSFWNFDTLFVPQNHPAREMQDTFFVSDPAVTRDHPAEYLARVAKVHAEGDYGSLGHRSPFSVEQTSKNVLRTHTTACSSRTLYQIAQQGAKPGKYFSIDRVFRNERMDRTHLCEFFQIEGFIVDYDLSLANMMQVLEEFFLKVGVNPLRFKPTYNPYTEPSMEIFGYHQGLEKWIEVGNSGVFRPEMLRPMGFDERVTAIAWGLSLERPAMMSYALNDIHKLEGPDVDLEFIETAPICRT
eukprot:TRINITY_DN4415_c0_g1_i1.p1 TRINITY_DN4415_c0_g1~~TRINITY_DN4415_c0_g1_i1.p1  ORF type:complete len:504 (+),score=120.92 TRINITY_DN4415_c0_g1_i1:63-1574(+)